MARWNARQLKKFQEAAQSLKLYRRAELYADNTDASLIDQLYVDPFPQDHALTTVLKPSTTFIIGRKGTGKSTIFQRAQSELTKSKTATSTYVDIKTVYESSRVDPTLGARIDRLDTAMSTESLTRLLLFRSFLSALVTELKDQLDKRLKTSIPAKLHEALTGNFSELFKGLDALLKRSKEDNFLNALGIKTVLTQSQQQRKDESNVHASAGVSLGVAPTARLGLGADVTSHVGQNKIIEFSEVLIRVFDIKQLIVELKTLLDHVGIRHLYVFVDDFSELPEDAMQIVVDVLLAPLNNWSDELVKFKIAAYPHRIYYGDIDKSKIDEVNLDLFKMYGSTDVTQMEEKAIDFTRRIVEKRINHYCGCSFETFLGSSDRDIWRHLFYATMANPRNLGYLLYFMYEASLIYDRPIGLRAVGDAAERYYEEKIEPYFAITKFVHESFAERSSIFSLKELLEAIISRARQVRRHQTTMMSKIKGTPPSSHFHVAQELEGLLATLELNFFITHYYEMKDRDGRRVIVFALNYGLCRKHQILFGRPQGETEFRLYFVERVFDDTALLRQYMLSNQEIRCDRCEDVFDLETLPALQMYGMKCPKCNTGTCKVVNLSKKYSRVLEQVNEDLLLPRTELGILHTLHASDAPMFAGDIAGELDCSYQLVGKRGKSLSERGLVDRKRLPHGRRKYQITQLAEESYFADKVAGDVAVDAPDWVAE